MQLETHSLESFFQDAVRSSYEGRLGLGPEITAYVSRVLCDFAEPENLFRLRDANGRRIEDLAGMVRASDPVFGAAPSFVAERSMRKYIGDYSLFLAGMCPEAIDLGPEPKTTRPTLSELIHTGRESYFIVGQFNVFEYEQEAQLFTRLSEIFERCVLGLALVRGDLWRTLNPPSPVIKS